MHQPPAPGTIADLPFASMLESVAARTPAPGGGAVAHATGGLASALAQMVVNYSIGKKSLAEQQGELRAALERLHAARSEMLAMAEEDAAAYRSLNELLRLDATDPRRIADLPRAIERCVEIPRRGAEKALEMLRLFESLAPITNRMLRSDLGIAAVLGEATVRACVWNVRINALELDAGQRREIDERCGQMLAEAARRAAAVERACEAG